MTLDISQLQDANIVDQEGSKVGSVGQIYVDDNTGQPTFATVKTGFFGNNETFVPLERAQKDGDDIKVPYTKDFIKDAPNVDAEGHITENEQDEIYRYYQLDNGVAAAGGDNGTADARGGYNAGTAGAAGAAGAAGGYAGAAGRDTDQTAGRQGAPGTDAGRAGDQQGVADADRQGVADADRQGVADADDRRGAADTADQQGVAGDQRDVAGGHDQSVTLHEEQVDVGKERVESGRVRIRKYVVTEQQTVTVPVQREEFEVVREPIADGQTGGTLGEETAEVTLSEERPVVNKNVVETERVGVKTNTVTENRDVQADVAHEEVAVERDGEDGKQQATGTERQRTDADRPDGR